MDTSVIGSRGCLSLQPTCALIPDAFIGMTQRLYVRSRSHPVSADIRPLEAYGPYTC